MPHFLIKAFAVGATLAVFSASSEPLNQAIQVEAQTNEAAIKSQQKIDRLSDETQAMLDEYRAANHQIKNLEIYNKHLQALLDSQLEEKQSLQQQLQDIETTQQEIVPLILNMLASLEKFIALDIPFLQEERQQRLDSLKEMVAFANVSNAEKYRRILEAYQIENEYGKTIEAYRGELMRNNVASTVDFLRLGRLALYYQSLDGSESGYWDRKNKQWEPLSADSRNAIRHGLRIARKEAAPDLLTLPVPAVEAAK